MATYQATTASNWPVIDPTAVTEVEAIIDDYEFVGNWDDLTVAVRDKTTDEPCLALYGYAAFEATKPVLNDEGESVD